MNSPPPLRNPASNGGKAPTRVLQAPYQKSHSKPSVSSAAGTIPSYADIAASSTSSTDSSSSDSSNSTAGDQQNGQNNVRQGHVDYRNYVFQPLEPEGKVTFDKYCGPTPESNWVVPGMLLVGAYPASTDDEETLDLIASILKEGVNKFVCLQQEYRQHGVTEQMWRSGQALRPYFEDVAAIVKQKSSLPCFANCPIVDERDLAFVHFPIKDCGITDDDRVLELARELVKDIAEGRVIYLHCWGGHGRTGTLVCIMLHLMYGLDPVEAMARCQLVHDLRQCPVVVGSPQTQTQRDQVTRVVTKLMTQSSYNRRTLSGEGSMLSSREAVEALAVPRTLGSSGSPRPSQTPISSSASSSQGVAVSKSTVNAGSSSGGSALWGAMQGLLPPPLLPPQAALAPSGVVADALFAPPGLTQAQHTAAVAAADEDEDEEEEEQEEEEDDEDEMLADADDQVAAGAYVGNHLHLSQEPLLPIPFAVAADAASGAAGAGAGTGAGTGAGLNVSAMQGQEEPDQSYLDDDTDGSRMRLGSDWNPNATLEEDEDEDNGDGVDEDEEGGSRMRLGSEWKDRREEEDEEQQQQQQQYQGQQQQQQQGQGFQFSQPLSQPQSQSGFGLGLGLGRPFFGSSQPSSQPQPLSQPPLSPQRAFASRPASEEEVRGAEEASQAQAQAQAQAQGQAGAVPPSQNKPSFRMLWQGRKMT